MRKCLHSRKEFLRAAALTGVSLGVGPLLAEGRAMAGPAKPNILLIMVDDLGKEWVGCYGIEGIDTPNVDALAAGGIRFTNAYSMAQCTPSRATLLTGQYPYRTGWVNHWDVPRWGVGYFDWRAYTTFATVLKSVGYATAAAGKWQINDFRIEPHAMRKHGFDDWCLWTGYETGNPPSAERYWDPYVNTPEGSKTYGGRFGPDVFTDFLIRFMKDHRDGPMLLYFPMVLTHSPFMTTPDEPEAKGNLARHKAMVRYADKLVGRLVHALDELGLRERTIVIFTTDNGSSRRVTGTLHGRKVAGGKGTERESGVCAPFIVNCPGRVPSGVVSDALTDFTDLLPTFAELAGAPLPDGYPLDGISMASLLLGKAHDSRRDWIMAMGHGPAVRDQAGIRGRTAFMSRVIRDKRYKVWVDTNRRIARLHDLKHDPDEQNNLLPSGRVEHQAELAKFQQLVDAMPAVDARPRYAPRKPLPWDRPAAEPEN